MMLSKRPVVAVQSGLTYDDVCIELVRLVCNRLMLLNSSAD